MWLSYVEYHLRPLPGFIRIQPWLDAAALRAWERSHQPPPPRSVKAAAIRRHASAARRVFVESGTFFGDMVAAVRPDFDRLFSIELSPRLACRAQRRFAADGAVTILPGDSGALLGPLLRSVGAPAVLWLDGHYSGWLTARGETDTPVRREIEAALDSGTPDDVLLIDDARLFGAHPAYPSVEDLIALVRSHRPGWGLQLEDDVVRVSAD
jgi:hypothetical protein